MDNYDLKIFLNNLEYASRDSIKRMIKDGDLSADNIVDILFHWQRKLSKIESIAYLFYDLEFEPENED